MGNRIKEKLLRGEPAVMVNVNHPAPGLVEVLAKGGADAIFIDCELGPHSLTDVENLVRAAHLAGLSAILRPDNAESWRLARFLARDIDGLMIPHVEGRGAAAKLVEILRYFRADDHADKLLVIMIESLEGLESLPEILATDGVDAVFCGSGDLGKSMGYTDKRHPAVQAKVAEIMATVARAGKAPGRFVRFDDLESCMQGGARLLYIHANHFIEHAMKEFAARVRGR